MADTQDERLAALGALLAVTDTGAATSTPTLTRSGRTVDAGGDVERLLIAPAHLTYSHAGTMHYPEASPGDVIRVTQRQADRLDALSATVAVDADLTAVADELGDGLWTDEKIGTAGAADLIAYVTQYPDERDRVRALEEARPKKKQRATVLGATEPTPLADADALAEAAGLEVEPPIGEDESGDPDEGTGT